VSRRLTKSKIIEAFEDLAVELERRGVRGQLFVVGGAAMALAYSAERSTLDVDGIFEPKSSVYEAAEVVAERLELPDDWLNDAVKGFLPGSDPNRVEVFIRPSLEVSVASPEYLLAMKMMAGRMDTDADDIRLLYGILGFATANEGLDLLERFWPGRALPVKSQLALEAMFGPSREGPADPFTLR